MEISLLGLAVIGVLLLGHRLGRLYLERLDQRERSGPAEQRATITASRRRAQGHLWIGAALLATIALLAILLGADRPELGPGVALPSLGLLAVAVAATWMAARAYRDARALRSGSTA
jgi:hypothetical protein